MPLLFSYGTLREPAVQLATFGRLLTGQADQLTGFEPSLAAIGDASLEARLGRTHHANIVAADNTSSSVPGMVFEVTDAELARADDFEAAFSYIRMTAILASGRDAWVYLSR